MHLLVTFFAEQRMDARGFRFLASRGFGFERDEFDFAFRRPSVGTGDPHGCL
jgi:hypothetical protein